MKICFITHDIAHIGGQEKVITIIANELSHKSNMEISIVITSARKSDKKTVYDLDKNVKLLFPKSIARGKYSDILYKLIRTFNKKIFPIKCKEFLKIIYFPLRERRAYQRFLSKSSFDIVIGLTVRPAAMLTFLDIKAKKVAWLHSTYERYFLKKNEFQWNQEILYQDLLPKLDNIVVLTDFDVIEYRKHFLVKPIRIYNPLPYEEGYKSLLKDNTILFVGRLDYDVKGLDYLVEILSDLTKYDINVHLLVVGDGAGREKFTEYAKRNNVLDKITMVGNTINVKAYYRRASICLVTSRVEGFGMVVIEAFEAGVPVISFANAGPSELIEDGVTGYIIKKYDVVDFAKKVRFLLMNDDLRLQMGKNAALKAKEFAISTISKQWVDFLTANYNMDE